MFQLNLDKFSDKDYKLSEYQRSRQFQPFVGIIPFHNMSLKSDFDK